jgi:phosphomannomutase
VADDGEVCAVLDERGRPVPAERLLVALARQLLAEHPLGAMVLEEGTAPAVARDLEAAGGRIITSSARRAAMAAAMREHGALFGGGPSGRFWYTAAGPPLPDGLITLTLLLALLSRSDRPLSEVLDRGLAAD